ncbi:MAG: helicase HerA domain-containing protein [Terriglobia bacterium]
MPDYEKLGVFYLGRTHDPARGKTADSLLLYDSKDLVTHAACFGMTGSGKTGLCLALLEEAAIDGVPALVIDPKGDISNLLLTFPELTPEAFLPWINEDDARSKGVSPGEYARQQAELWKNGLAAWGQDASRIRRLRDAADFAVYTPGSTAGLPVSIFKSFAAPGTAIVEDPELLRERINGTATALLGLLGIQADPVQSREHILLATILGNAWKQGRDLDLGALIEAVQSPPVSRIGVLDLEAFYPAKERFALSMALNNLLASPGFEAWLEGEPLDIASLLYTPQGKPRVSIFSIAHLGDAERMFFVSLLLNQILGWMRMQSGTTSLRAILYMDEIFGYFPPVANPPSKQPLLTLLKQARAFGVGVVLATQNPVDLDYKGLANAGTWFIGRLQTERDRARVLDGLESAAGGVDRQQMERILSQLNNRVFLMNNVHEDAPVVFETRWVMSYLRGPLTRAQIKTLMAPRSQSTVAPPVAPSAKPAPEVSSDAASRPVLPPDVEQYFVPVRGTRASDAALIYQPVLLGSAQVRFVDAKAQVDYPRTLNLLTRIEAGAIPVDWQKSTEADIALDELERQPAAEALFGPLPGAAAKGGNYAAWSRELVEWLYGSQTLELFRSPSLGETSHPGESERDFRIRLQQASREKRDQGVEQLRRAYAPKITAIEDRIRRAQQAVEREREQANQQKVQTVISVGATLLSAFLGRKAMSSATMGRAATAARAGSRTWKEAQDTARAEENVDALKQRLADLEAQFAADTQALDSTLSPATEALDRVSVKLKKANINVRLVALCWMPRWQDSLGKTQPAF